MKNFWIVGIVLVVWSCKTSAPLAQVEAVDYSNYQEDLGAQIQNSFGAHRNGRVYDEHPFIESVEAVIATWVAGDVEKMASYFAADAKFTRLGKG